MQLLDVAKQCCYRSGDNVLNALFSTDDNATAWQGYLQQAGKLIPREHNWQKLRREAIIITAGSTDKYDLPDDFLDMTTDKIYNITDNRYILSETDEEAFATQAMKNNSQSTIRFRIMNDKIVFTYPIDDGLELKYSYNTNYICKLNGEYKDHFNNDEDEFLLDSELLILKALALRAVDLGLPEQDKREKDYQDFLRMEMANDGAPVFFNKYHRGFVNKTTPVEYSVYDKY